MQNVTTKNDSHSDAKKESSQQKETRSWNFTWEVPVEVCLGETGRLWDNPGSVSFRTELSEGNFFALLPAEDHFLHSAIVWVLFYSLSIQFAREKQKANRIAFVLITKYPMYFHSK